MITITHAGRVYSVQAGGVAPPPGFAALLELQALAWDASQGALAAGLAGRYGRSGTPGGWGGRVGGFDFSERGKLT